MFIINGHNIIIWKFVFSPQIIIIKIVSTAKYYFVNLTL